jgi:uncharacterized protein (TIGR02270 family)
MVQMNSRIVPQVIRQHADDAVVLATIRRRLASAPHATLRHLRRFDDRLVAQLDGLAIAGEYGARFCEQALESPGQSEVFVAAVRAIEDRSRERLDRIVKVAQAVPASEDGLVAAFGWVEKGFLHGIVVEMLGAEEPFTRGVAMAACAQHGVDPFRGLTRPFESDPIARRQLFRAMGEVGLHDAVPACVNAISDDDPDTRFWAASSAVLLGSRGVALDSLCDAALSESALQLRALRLVLQASDVRRGHRLLQDLGGDPARLRLLMLGSGVTADPAYVPWLVDHMSNDATARVAGEAFSLITGADLALLDLERKPPENFEPGPNDDPNDPNVDMDEDDGLPWPDPEKVEKWWAANEGRFQKGTRYFMGAPVTREHCFEVLKNGYQRQRILAAHYLCLLDPGTPLFNTSAPAWRQQRLLAQMQ